jgi:hypothetical protein
VRPGDPRSGGERGVRSVRAVGGAVTNDRLPGQSPVDQPPSTGRAGGPIGHLTALIPIASWLPAWKPAWLTSLPTLVVGVVALAMLFLLSRWPRVPGGLLVLVAGIIVSLLLNLYHPDGVDGPPASRRRAR